MRIFCSRVKMAGMGGSAYGYDVYVPLADVPHKGDVTYVTITKSPDGERMECVSYAEATAPQAQRDMPARL